MFLSTDGLSKREVDVDNLFSRLGYFTRFHIQVFPIDFKNNASDIDVYAVRFSSHLNPDLKLIEVKEGYGTVTDLFQLFGFKSYFQESEAFLIAQKIHDTTREIAKNLGVSVFTFDRLKELVRSELEWIEERKRISVDLDLEHLKKTINYLRIIKSLDEELFWTYHYLWLETNPFRKLSHLQRLFSKARILEDNANKVASDALDWYLREIFCLSLLASVGVAFDCIDLRQSQVFPYIENKFYNIGSTKEGKLKVKEGIDKLAEQIEKLSKGMIKVPSIDLVPTYVDNLSKLVDKLMRNAAFVQSYLLIDNNVFRINLKGETRNLKEFTTSEIQYKTVREINNLMLKVLYEGNAIDVTFKDFV